MMRKYIKCVGSLLVYANVTLEYAKLLRHLILETIKLFDASGNAVLNLNTAAYIKA